MVGWYAIGILVLAAWPATCLNAEDVNPEDFDLNGNSILDTEAEQAAFIDAGNQALLKSKEVEAASLVHTGWDLRPTEIGFTLNFDEEGVVDKEKYSANLNYELVRLGVSRAGFQKQSLELEQKGFSLTFGLGLSASRSRDFQSGQRQTVDRITLTPLKMDYGFSGAPASYWKALRPFLKLGVAWSETDKEIAPDPPEVDSNTEFVWEYGVKFPLSLGDKNGWGITLKQKLIFDKIASDKESDALEFGLSKKFK